MKFFLAAILLVSLIALSSADDDEFGKPTKVSELSFVLSLA